MPPPPNAVAIILPPTVPCPFLPPIPNMSRLTGQVESIQVLPCMGKLCPAYYGMCNVEKALAAKAELEAASKAPEPVKPA